MMHARASDAPVEGVSSARGSIRNPVWRVSDTADVMFNIDNSPERNGLWSFRKILCFFFFFLDDHFLALCLDSRHPSVGFDGQLPTKLLSPQMKWTLAVKTEQSEVVWGKMCFVGTSFQSRNCFWYVFLGFFYSFVGYKKKKVCRTAWGKF